MRVRSEKQQRDGGNDRRAGSVKQPLQHINAKHAGHRQLFFSRQQQRPHRLACAPKEKHRGEAGQLHRVNRSEMRWTQVLLKNFPGERAQRVTSIDGKNRKNQKEWICIAESVKKICPAEILEMNDPARALADKSRQKKPAQDDKKLPR